MHLHPAGDDDQQRCTGDRADHAGLDLVSVDRERDDVGGENQDGTTGGAGKQQCSAADGAEPARDVRRRESHEADRARERDSDARQHDGGCHGDQTCAACADPERLGVLVTEHQGVEVARQRKRRERDQGDDRRDGPYGRPARLLDRAVAPDLQTAADISLGEDDLQRARPRP